MPVQNWVELLPEAALVVDDRGLVTICNASATTLFGPDGLSLGSALTEVNGFAGWLGGSGPEAFRGHLHARRQTGVP